MKTVKMLLVALSFCATTYAAPDLVEKKGSIEAEIERLLADSDLIIEKGLHVKVLFKVTEDMSIDIHSITSENKEVNAFLMSRLQGEKLTGKGWFKDKLYELPVRVKMGRS